MLHLNMLDIIWTILYAVKFYQSVQMVNHIVIGLMISSKGPYNKPYNGSYNEPYNVDHIIMYPS